MIMEVVKLNTTQRELNAIKNGKLNSFAHEIRPETNALFCELDEDGYVRDIDGVLQPRHYDAIKLSTEHENRVFTIEKSEIVLFEDKYGDLITYEVNGEEYIKAQIVYYLGDDYLKLN
jgi:hypothetical protein